MLLRSGDSSAYGDTSMPGNDAIGSRSAESRFSPSQNRTSSSSSRAACSSAAATTTSSDAERSAAYQSAQPGVAPYAMTAPTTNTRNSAGDIDMSGAS